MLKIKIIIKLLLFYCNKKSLYNINNYNYDITSITIIIIII